MPRVESSQERIQTQIKGFPYDYRILRSEERGELNPAYGYLYRFGQFELDSRRRMLSRGDSPVVLTAKTFEVLLFLAQNPNRLVTKEELLEAVWSDTSVEEGNLTRYISHLRKALGDDAEDARLIVTIARKGYQFTARVTVAEASDVAKFTAIRVVGAGTSGTDPQSVEFSTREAVAKLPPPRPHLRKWLEAAALFAVIAVALWSYLNYRPDMALSATDTIVLAGIKNETSDPAFDDALNTALRYAAEQTPYLNVLGIDKVLGTLAELRLPAATKLTPEVARQVCLRTNSKLVIASSIADVGNGYRIALDAVDCRSGRIIAGIREKVADRNQVVHVLGVAVVELRAKLGEPSASLARFNKPLEQALSSSVDALQVGTLGYQRHIVGDAAGAIPYYKRALELDPNLAPTYEGLGVAYGNVGERNLSEAAYTRAFELRARMTAPSRFEAEYLYYSHVTGELDKALSPLLEEEEIFPRNGIVHINLADCLSLLGQPEKAVDELREAARLQPTAYMYGWWITESIHADRVNAPPPKGGGFGYG